MYIQVILYGLNILYLEIYVTIYLCIHIYTNAYMYATTADIKEAINFEGKCGRVYLKRFGEGRKEWRNVTKINKQKIN